MPRRADNNANVPWTEAYGDSIEDRAQNIFDGTVPLTVLQPGNQPQIGLENEFVVQDDGESIEVQDINFTRRYIGYEAPNDEVVYVRSQRYGEIVANTRSHRNNGRGVIDQETGILKAVYAVTGATSCTCQHYVINNDCKHIQAVQLLLDYEQQQQNDGGGGGFVDDNNMMDVDEFGFNPNEVAEVQDVDAFADGTIGGRLRQRRMTERQQPRRSGRQRRSTRRSGGTLDGDIFVSSFASSQNQLYEFVEELERLKL